MSKIRVFKGQVPASQKKTPAGPVSTPPDIVGQPVMWREDADSQPIIGVVVKQEGSVLHTNLAVPNQDGLLMVAKDAPAITLLDNVTTLDTIFSAKGDVRSWNSNHAVKPDAKAATVVKDEDSGLIVDYQNVTFQGFGSTFQSTTPEDRDGDYVVEGAFDKSLRRFRENAVMLTDHMRAVEHLMGHYEQITSNETGLALTGKVTNSPHPDAQHVRFLIMEGSLKTLSMGGLFFYLEDFRGIQEVDLHEVSLVVVPANPDASFQVRSLNTHTAEKIFRTHAKRFGGEVRLKNS